MNPKDALNAAAGVLQGVAYVDSRILEDAPARPILRRILKTFLEILVEILLKKLGPTFFSGMSTDEDQ